MKFINYIYFNVYSWYLNMQNSGRKVDPTSMTSFMFGLFIGGCFFLVDLFYYHVFLNSYPSSIHEFILLFVILASSGVINTFYLSNNRYLTVYYQHTEENSGKSIKKDMFISFFILLSPLLILFIGVIIYLFE